MRNVDKIFALKIIKDFKSFDPKFLLSEKYKNHISNRVVKNCNVKFKKAVR
jgi:hypothetical protein